jgi:L-2-hydroxyglutarate oxidase LhgO
MAASRARKERFNGMTDKLDCVVVGAGVVGLAIARSVAGSGRQVVVLDTESQIGTHSSSRNSEVIHAGIYYPEKSLKARLCVRGRDMLYRYCETHGIAHQRIGKLIVATGEAELPRLAALQQQAALNGVDDLQFIAAEEARKIEPNVESVGALLSPSTGIVDSHAFMTALRADLEVSDGVVVLNSRVSDVSPIEDGIEFQVGDERFECVTLINSAGLGAVELMSDALHLADNAPTMHLAKGHYFSYQGKSPFGHLIYPLPSGGGLGIHATNDLAGAARFGPDVTWVDSLDYEFDESRKADFVAAIKNYFPALDADRLIPGYTGIRPKLHGPGAPAPDFLIQGERDHGVRGLVNLMGIESPGLTASLAIAEYVAGLLG